MIGLVRRRLLIRSRRHRTEGYDRPYVMPTTPPTQPYRAGRSSSHPPSSDFEHDVIIVPAANGTSKLHPASVITGWESPTPHGPDHRTPFWGPGTSDGRRTLESDEPFARRASWRSADAQLPGRAGAGFIFVCGQADGDAERHRGGTTSQVFIEAIGGFRTVVGSSKGL